MNALFISAYHIIYILGYVEETGKKIAVILMESNVLQIFQKMIEKEISLKNSLKVYLIDGSCI